MSSKEAGQNVNSLEPTAGGNARISSPPPRDLKAKHAFRRNLVKFFLGVFLLYLAVAIYQSSLKSLPADLSLEGQPCLVNGSDIEFLYDVTGTKGGQRVSQQMIFDRALGLIHEAQDLVVVDLFLFNEYLGKDRNVHRRLCQEVSQALVEKKRSRPNIRMVVITDPVNEVYGGFIPEQFKTLRAAGIPVVVTDLTKLRDSNPIYSSLWRMFVQWFGTSPDGSWPHPFAKDASGVGLRSWLALLNFKANHRKLIVADAPAPAGGRQMVGMVMSANPHDASSAHGNVSLLVRGGIWRDLLRGEQAILAFSGTDLDIFSWLPAYATTNAIGSRSAGSGQAATVQVLTEAKIRKGILEVLGKAQSGDQVDIGMFYLSERSTIKALLDAAQKGTGIRLLLDPNRDAFGYQKNGIPNRPVAAELVKRGHGKITVRWYNTHGEQFHTKMALLKLASQTTLFAGSANLTRRNIGDLNLETDIAVTGLPDLPAIQAAQRYFDELWGNQDLDCTVPYETFAETSMLKRWQYLFQERSGLTTF